MTPHPSSTLEVDIDDLIFDKGGSSDPYLGYAALRERGSSFWSERQRAWLITAYDDVLALLRDRRASSDLRAGALASGPRVQALGSRGGWEALGSVMPLMDPPDHTRLRRLVGTAFGPRVVENVRPRIEQTVHRLLDEADERGTLELMQEFAFPLTISIVSELLGVPPEDRSIFRKHSPRMSAFLDFRNMTYRQLRNAVDSTVALTAYFTTLAERRRAAPGDDLLSALLAAEDDGDVLTHEELVTMCIVLISTGHETTMGLIGNGTIALVRNPNEAARLRSDRDLTRPAVEELIRYDTPVQYVIRTAVDDIEVGDVVIRNGEQAILLLGAANRDPLRFSDPDALRLDRTDTSQISFGHGIHSCLGAALARIEGQTAIRATFERFPELACSAPPVWRPTTAVRSPLRVPLELNNGW